MKKQRVLKELPSLVMKAKAHGIACRSGSNGGGWCNFAVSCGAEGPLTKLAAKAFVREKLMGIAASETVAAHQVKVAAFKKGLNVTGDGFLLSYEWRKLRMVALKKYGAVCQCCGATPKTGAVMNVDHIKPRKLFPQLALDVDNLQILCGDCNHGKGNWDMTDWRQEQPA